MEDDSEKLRFPLGRHPRVARYAAEQVAADVGEIAAFPARLRRRLAGAADAELERRYRPGGWTARQVIHHLADSHVNSYVRFKLALTEERPIIKPYDEAAWAELPDGRTGDIGRSLDILDGLHARWTALLRGLDEAAWRRSFIHPEQGREIHLFENAAIYAWHGRHHLAHVDLALAGGLPAPG